MRVYAAVAPFLSSGTLLSQAATLELVYAVVRRMVASLSTSFTWMTLALLLSTKTLAV